MIQGQSVSVWNQDGGTSSEQAYKAVPFYISNRGYGIFINHPGEVEVEVGSEKISRVGVSVADTSLEWYLIYGDTPLQVSREVLRLGFHCSHKCEKDFGPLHTTDRSPSVGFPASSKKTATELICSLPPAWTFGLWLSTSFLTDYDSKTVSGFLQGMHDRDCHVRVFHFDCFWMKQYEWYSALCNCIGSRLLIAK